MQETLEKAEMLLKEAKYSEALDILLSISNPEKDPALCAKTCHCYFKQKRFRKAAEFLKKIPKEILDSEPYQEAKKELKKLKGFYLAALMEL